MGYALKVKNEHGVFVKIPVVANSEVDLHEADRVIAENKRAEAERVRIEAENKRVEAETKRTEAEEEREAFWADKTGVYVGTGEMPEGVSVQIDPSGEAGFSEEDINNIVNKVVQRVSLPSKIGYVTILAEAWVGDDSPYSQVVAVDGATENSQVDLTPSVEQLSIFHHKDLAFVTENEDGVVTVYAIGQKPENDYTIQVTITEVTA